MQKLNRIFLKKGQPLSEVPSAPPHWTPIRPPSAPIRTPIRPPLDPVHELDKLSLSDGADNEIITIATGRWGRWGRRDVPLATHQAGLIYHKCSDLEKDSRSRVIFAPMLIRSWKSQVSLPRNASKRKKSRLLAKVNGRKTLILSRLVSQIFQFRDLKRVRTSLVCPSLWDRVPVMLLLL